MLILNQLLPSRDIFISVAKSEWGWHVAECALITATSIFRRRNPVTVKYVIPVLDCGCKMIHFTPRSTVLMPMVCKTWVFTHLGMVLTKVIT